VGRVEGGREEGTYGGGERHHLSKILGAKKICKGGKEVKCILNRSNGALNQVRLENSVTSWKRREENGSGCVQS